MQRESKKIAYKLAAGLPNGQTLQEILKKALQKYKRTADRLENLGADGSDVRFINANRQHQAVTFGLFHKVTKGAAQHVIDMEQKGDEWSLQSVTAKSATRPAGEFVEGTLFFGIWKNHVLLHQTISCRSDHFEDYVSWLIGKAKDGSSEGASPLVSLSDPLPKKIRAKDLMPVKNIKLHSDVDSREIPRKQTRTETTSTAVNVPAGEAWEGVKAILRSLGTKLPPQFNLDSALARDELKVTLELKCTKKSARATAGELLRQLGHSLSHTPGDFYTITLADGTILRAKELKVETHVRVECADKLPVPESMFKAMMEYLQELIENETIIEEEAFGNAK
jgi:hypothetical protein